MCKKKKRRALSVRVQKTKREQKTKTKTKTRRTLTISHSSSETTVFCVPEDDDASPLDDDDGERGADFEGTEEEALCCTPVTRTPSTMRTGKDMLGTRAKSKRDEEDTIDTGSDGRRCAKGGWSVGDV